MSLTVLLFICLALGYAGYQFGLLTKSGAFLTILVGSTVVYALDSEGLVLLLLFFGSSSLLSKIGKARKQSVDQIVEKDGARDGWQVLANGGTAMLASIGVVLTNEFDFLLVFLIVIAASNADTWASEIGPLSKKEPISIRTFKPVLRGTSGGVSLLGTLATIIGALFIATAGDILFDLSVKQWLIVAAGGVLGSMLDTVLGGTVQRKYRCQICGKETEKKIHHGTTTQYVRGWKWLGNDAVNYLSSTLAGLIGFMLYRLW